ncbi:VF530 family DNA-binding protein [Aliamphritea spongicola]|nr:VF530 family DNA-binding protein [Aliamphritea spongicola]
MGLNQLLTELVEHYGFEILYAYLNINCFKTNPSIQSSEKFLKKTQWARERSSFSTCINLKICPGCLQNSFQSRPGNGLFRPIRNRAFRQS